MTVLFVAAGEKDWASSRMRAYWPARHMDADARPFLTLQQHGYPRGYEAVVFQKYVNTDAVAAYQDTGARVWWDMCDPSWWWEPEPTADITNAVDGVVLSNEALRRDYEEWLADYGIEDPPPVFVIPDRLELSHFEAGRRRQHTDSDPVRLIWYGVAQNRIALYAAVANLERLVVNGHNIELTVMDDQPEKEFRPTNYFPIYHTKWSLSREVQIIAAHDIALLPPYPGPWGRVKSNNKTLTAILCGLPHSKGETYGDLVKALSADERQRFVDNWQPHIRAKYDVCESAVEWDELLC